MSHQHRRATDLPGTRGSELRRGLAESLTRVLGYVGLRHRVLGPRATAVMDAVPRCVLISVIAPAFVSHRPADLAALAVTVFAAVRVSLLPTVVIGVAAAGLFRHFAA